MFHTNPNNTEHKIFNIIITHTKKLTIIMTVFVENLYFYNLPQKGPVINYQSFLLIFNFNNYLIIYSHPGCQSPVFLQSFLIASSQVIFLVITSKASCGALCATIPTVFPE